MVAFVAGLIFGSAVTFAVFTAMRKKSRTGSGGGKSSKEEMN